VVIVPVDRARHGELSAEIDYRVSLLVMQIFHRADSDDRVVLYSDPAVREHSSICVHRDDVAAGQ
jgi:hypothetical protein